MKVKKSTCLAFFLVFGVFCASAGYYAYFRIPLDGEMWQNVDGFTRIIIPDTFVYRDIIDDSNIVNSIIFSSIKNTIGPSFIWVLADKNWVLVSLFNSLMLFMALVYQARIARLLGISEHRINMFTVVLALLPATLYHSVGALKEIPTLLFLLGFFHHHVKRERIRCLSFAVLLVLFRYQLVFVVMGFVVCVQFRKKSLLVGAFVLVVVAALYPYVRAQHDTFVRGTLEEHRVGQEDTIGAYIESIQQNVPILSVFAVLCRIAQSVFGYFVSFARNPTFYEDGCLSMIRIVYLASHAILLCYWLRWFKSLILALFHVSAFSYPAIQLLLLGLLYVVPVAGMSFIHPRYLYPVTGIILVGSAVGRRSLSSASGGTVSYRATESVPFEIAVC